MSAPLATCALAVVVIDAIGTTDATALQQPLSAPQHARGAVHLLDAIPAAMRSTLHSPALAPPDVGELAPLLCELEFVANLNGDRSIYLLPIPVDRAALDSLRLDPAGSRPQLVAGSRIVAAERLAAFRPLKQRVTPDGRHVCCVDKPMELKLPVDRMGPAAQLTLLGGPFPRELAAAITLVVDGRALHPRVERDAAGATAAALPTLTFELPDALGLTTAVLSIARAGAGGEEVLLAGYQLDEANGRDRAVVAAGVDPKTTRLQWRPAPPAPILPLRVDRERESSSDVLLLPGRVGLVGVVAANQVEVETAGAPVRFAANGADVLAADVAVATLARVTIGASGATARDRARVPLLLQPQACWLRHYDPMRGADVAEPVHALVDHWQVGSVTRRGLTLAVGSEWRVALPARSTRLEFDLATLELASTPPNSPPPRLTVAVLADGCESELGAVALAPATRADAPDRFDAIAWSIAASVPSDGNPPAPRTLLFRVEAAPAAPFTSQLRSALLAEPKVIVGGAPAPSRRPNLLIYLVDTLRADHVHCLGNERETTPNVGALAREGILFTRASSQAPWTRPSVATLFTGLIPEHHTVTSESGLPRAAATLAERMRDADYETAAFTANAQVHAAGLDFEQGFDHFCGFPVADKFARSDEVLDQVLPWLDAHADRPFFIYVQTIDPHDPYDPPPETRGRFEHEYHGRIDDAHTSIGDLMRLAPLNEQDHEHIVDLYDEEIAFADLEFGRLIARLKELGRYDDTVILFLSDHGEELLDHGRLGHPRRLWNEVLHVPMVLRLPGAPAPRGLVVDELVRTMDWLPTLAVLFDLPSPDPGYEGVDLAPAWSRRDGGDPRELRQLPELDAIAQTEPDLESFQHGAFKLILEQSSLGNRASAHLFDFTSDPHEQHDLAADRPEVVGSMRRRLTATKAGYAIRGFAPLNARRVSHFDPAVERALRQLGYVDEGK